MKIYDISQEVFTSAVFAGDPAPKREVLSSIEEGAVCNLTAFSMCAHNGTHIDAPYHFFNDGETVEKLDLSRMVGYAWVTEQEGMVDDEGARAILEAAKEACEESAKRILIKGDAVVTAEAAEVFAHANVELVGNESQTVGPENAPMQVHKILLGKGIVLLEGVRLGDVPEGVYFLCAQPLSLGGADGAPCRAVLVSF
jgi:arylformamidase